MNGTNGIVDPWAAQYMADVCVGIESRVRLEDVPVRWHKVIETLESTPSLQERSRLVCTFGSGPYEDDDDRAEAKQYQQMILDIFACKPGADPGPRPTTASSNGTHPPPPLSDELKEALRNAKKDEDQYAVKDYGHALVLAPLFLGRFRWAYHLGTWREWTGVVWQDVQEEYVVRVASDLLRAHYLPRLQAAKTPEAIKDATKPLTDACVYARVLAALMFLRGWDGILTNPDQWDADPWGLNVLNGIVNLHSGELRPHDPADLCAKLAPITYDRDARKDGPWQKHVNLFMKEGDVQRQVRRDLGLGLVGATMEEALSIWYGTGANGKTTTSRAVMAALGSYAVRAAPNLLVQSKYERHPTELADLAGARVVFSVEIDEGKKLAEAVVKELSGGDKKKARHMRQDFFEFEQTFSITLIVNHKPVITGTDVGIWRRIRIIPWDQTITTGKRPQEEVVAELVSDGSAMLNWMLAGLRDWQQDRGWVAPEVRATTEAYRQEQDVLGAFLAECCDLGPKYTYPVGDLYRDYVNHNTETETGDDPVTKAQFGKLLRDRGIGQARKETERYWVGLRKKK